MKDDNFLENSSTYDDLTKQQSSFKLNDHTPLLKNIKSVYNVTGNDEHYSREIEPKLLNYYSSTKKIWQILEPHQLYIQE